MLNTDRYKIWLLCLLIASCDKELEIEIPVHDNILVTEAWIEQGKPANVLLSLSAPYFASIDTSNIRDFAVTKAKVSVMTDSLAEIMVLKPNYKLFPPYYYFSTETYGETEKEYVLEIVYNGGLYKATTSIPRVLKPDSIWHEQTNTTDTAAAIYIRIKDEPDKENFFRVFYKRLDKDKGFETSHNSVFSDQLFADGAYTYKLTRNDGEILNIDKDIYFHKGDMVVIKFCSIDKKHFEFWNSLQSNKLNASNPFSASNRTIKSNISGGIGIWGGYAAWYDTVRVE